MYNKYKTSTYYKTVKSIVFTALTHNINIYSKD